MCMRWRRCDSPTARWSHIIWRRQTDHRNSNGDIVSARPSLANTGTMREFVGEFEVTSALTGQFHNIRFSHMWNGIATRHSDTIDAKFFVDGVARVVGLAHTAFVKFRERA